MNQIGLTSQWDVAISIHPHWAITQPNSSHNILYPLMHLKSEKPVFKIMNGKFLQDCDTGLGASWNNPGRNVDFKNQLQQFWGEVVSMVEVEPLWTCLRTNCFLIASWAKQQKQTSRYFVAKLPLPLCLWPLDKLCCVTIPLRDVYMIRYFYLIGMMCLEIWCRSQRKCPGCNYMGNISFWDVVASVS